MIYLIKVIKIKKEENWRNYRAFLLDFSLYPERLSVATFDFIKTCLADASALEFGDTVLGLTEGAVGAVFSENDLVTVNKYLYGIVAVDIHLLAHFLRNIPAVDVVGIGEIIGFVVADDVLGHRVGVHNHDATCRLEVGDYLGHTGIGVGNMVFDVLTPESLLLLKLGFTESDLVGEKLEYSWVEVLFKILLNGRKLCIIEIKKFLFLICSFNNVFYNRESRCKDD